MYERGFLVRYDQELSCSAFVKLKFDFDFPTQFEFLVTAVNDQLQ